MTYICTLCNYSTNNQANFSHHKKTKKHLAKLDTKYLNNKNCSIVDTTCNDNATQNCNIEKKNATEKSTRKYECKNCKNIYLHHSSYYRHKKNCLIDNKSTDLNNENNKDKIINDLKSQLEIYEYKNKISLLEKENEFIKKLEKEKTELLNKAMNNAYNKINQIIDDNNRNLLTIIFL